ncbi:tyrosine-type recombinase/integrase [Aeromicrobium panaciterrae]|uniref:tyrosine-type recombinase/integrase n=1 Tax=Aeromicrobium panaciterrae TaxID=363861 RepID=UPI0031DC3A86
MPKKRSHGDGGLYWIASKGLWRGTIELGRDETGKRITKHVHSKSQKACREKLDAIKAEIAAHGAPLDTTATVGDWADKWLIEYKKPHVDPKTYTGYASCVKVWIKPEIGEKRVSALKPSDILAVHGRVRAAGMSSTTALGVHRVMNMLLEDARKQGLCARNVATDVTKPQKAASTRDSIPLPQATELLTVAAGHDLGAMWWFKLLGGPRQGEILGATLESLDLVNNLYRVNWSLEEVPKEHGCGPKTETGWPCGKKQGAACSDWRWRIPDGFEMIHLFGRYCLTRPKSMTGRVVPLFPQMADMIADYLERHEDTPNPYGLIFRKDDGTPYTATEDAQAWRDLLFEAGVIGKDELAPGKSEITGHWARHTTITLLASLGVDAQLIGEIVGHSSEEVTRIYRHAHADEKAHAMAKLGNLMLALPAGSASARP